MNKVVIYKRLSKEDKTKTQHGFDSQQMDIDYYLSSVESHEVIDSFQEFVSGGADLKPELEKALELCRKEGATLVVAKLDRLSRRVSQIAQYMEGSVRFKVSTLPSANNFQLHLYAALAEEERETIRLRVKRGLAAAKAKGVKLGAASPKYQEKLKAGEINHVGKSRHANTTAHLLSIKDLFVKSIELTKQGVVQSNGKVIKAKSFNQIATALNTLNLCVPPSGVRWNSGSVQRAVTVLDIKL